MARLSLLYAFLIITATWRVSQAKQETFFLPDNNAAQLYFTDTLLPPQLLSYVDEIRQNGTIPGISIGVVRLGKNKEPIIQLASSGRKTEEGNGHDLTPDTLFCLASCSKAFLATSVGLLMEDYATAQNVTPLPSGLTRFDWDTKVIDIVPKELEWGLHDIGGDDWATRKASIADILGHVSGLPRHDHSYRLGDTPEDIVRRMRLLRTSYELREIWSYNNQFYVLGAYLVSHYANTSYSDFVERRLFKPLGMTTSTFSPSAANSSGLLTDTWAKFGRQIPFWFDDSVGELKAGAGGVISSAQDMVKWLAVLLNEGQHPATNKTVIPKSVFDAVTTSRWIVSGKPAGPIRDSIVGYGMGWMRSNYGDVEVVEHTGGIPGFSTLVAFVPQRNLGVVILSNANEKAVWNSKILMRILDDVLGSKTSMTAVYSSQAEAERSPTMELTSPSLALEDYTGLYTAPGYLPIRLCSKEIHSKHCRDVISDFAAIHNSSTLESSLYAAFPAVWASHVRLSHFSGDVFNITFTALFPNGYGQNTTAFETAETGESEGWVEFKVAKGEVEGFSLVIDHAAYESRKRKIGSELTETGDAWFAKA
ncbi:beta-lactamase/transpeptidase-like protein [Dichomitus squalens LYAD-421 SS1]|uniref:Beta-lactamase/transpeptidase-like protein n=1 Tax=Dichomitus squalens (strain LYAD-421) TaxID=732165 RepID=R7SZ45_DICSQ|nr:beta-lactamase/transpeptidase-like protein [Dichomitus squalens LYAD-421 SS1]EJF60227.1 beta-lactamase/transpeptidase-like protein [Dichomitus squalens LYAD-421 SS1]